MQKKNEIQKIQQIIDRESLFDIFISEVISKLSNLMESAKDLENAEIKLELKSIYYLLPDYLLKIELLDYKFRKRGYIAKISGENMKVFEYKRIWKTLKKQTSKIR